MDTLQSSPFSNYQYTVGWICALPIELAATKGMLDEEHGAPQIPAAEADQNAYLLGRIGNFKVVVACLPKDQIGSVSAAIVARDMVSTFLRYVTFQAPGNYTRLETFANIPLISANLYEHASRAFQRQK